MNRQLPRNVTLETQTQAFKLFAGVVGQQWASDAQADRESYHDPYNPGDPLEFVSGGFVAPASVEEVQEVVKIANRLRVPLWPVSTGKNLAYGGAAPLVPGTIVLDLRRMNRIIEVDEDLAYAFVEPGVNFFDLNKYLREKNIKLWMSVPGPGWGSLIGNGVERGVGYGYHSEHYSHSAGLEVVLPSGELMRCGMGAMENNASWPLFNFGYGPAVDAIFTQSNYGVVTKMSRFLLPEPEVYMSCEVNVHHDSDLESLVDVLRQFQLDQTIRNPVVITNAELIASFLSVRSQWYDEPRPLPDEVVTEIQNKLGIGRWNASFALYGSETSVNDGWNRVVDSARKIKGVEVKARTYAPGDVIEHPRDQSQAGIPNLTEFSLANWYGSGGHIDFSPLGPNTGKNARKMLSMVRERLHENGYDHLGGFYCNGRVMRFVNTLVFRKSERDELHKLRKVFGELVRELGDAGYGEYRTHLAYMDDVAKTFNFNDHAMLRFQELLKDAIDPNGIIAPGKSGVWPKEYRDNQG